MPKRTLSTVADVDWPALLATLRAERARLDREIAAIEVLAERGAPVAPRKTPAAKPRATVRKVSGPRGGRPGASPEVQATARVAYERGEAVAKIAKAAGVRPGSVYYWASTGKWKRRGAGGEELTAKIRCPACEQITTRDPCAHCGKPVRKYAA